MGFRNLLVSGLCVTANRPAFLERAVAWWRAQEWPRKELVIVDGSRRELRLDFSAAADVRHVVLEPDLEMGAKHNRAIAEAQGEILAYHDDDDWYHPRRLIKQLEPIAMGLATVTGIPRDLTVYTPGARFVRFAREIVTGPVLRWVGNGNELWKGKRQGARFGFHDGSAVFARSVLRHAIPHKPLQIGQKLVFLNDLLAKRERMVSVPNDNLFVYVRHGSNTWQYNARLVERPAPTPSWVPADVLAFWRRGVA
jgi:glycosyltransferase involved in cell wall biosynthesis